MLFLLLMACEVVPPEVGHAVGLLHREDPEVCNTGGLIFSRSGDNLNAALNTIVETQPLGGIWRETDDWTVAPGDGVVFITVTCIPGDLVRVSWWGL